MLIGTKSNRDGVGALLKLTSEGRVQVDQRKGGTSYMSASDPRVHFGLGKRTKIESLVDYVAKRAGRQANQLAGR